MSHPAPVAFGDRLVPLGLWGGEVVGGGEGWRGSKPKALLGDAGGGEEGRGKKKLKISHGN